MQIPTSRFSRDCKSRLAGCKSRLAGQGEADAQRLVREAVDDKIIQLKAIEKWNGVMPIVQGDGSSSFIDIGAIAKGRK